MTNCHVQKALDTLDKLEVPNAALSDTYTLSNVTPDRTFDPTATNADETAMANMTTIRMIVANNGLMVFLSINK